jgi:hypothetical protein
MEFVKCDVPQANRSVGANTLYSKNKGNTFFLLNLNGLPSDNTWSILTNNYRFYNKNPYPFISDKELPNDRFLISKFLTYFFRSQNVIPSGKRNYYYNRIRQLFIIQRKALDNRLNSKQWNDRKTKTFIKFSYKHTTFYLGFYEMCRCDNKFPAAVVQSNGRIGCHMHQREQITKPPQALSARLDHRQLNSHKSKFVSSNRRNVQYIKSSLLYEDEILGVPVHGLIIAKIFNGKLNPKKPVKRDKEDIQIYLSKHVKTRNLGINDVEIIDKECGTIGIKRKQIYDRFARESGRASRIEKHVLRDMARDSYNEEERRYANNRLAEIAEQEKEERTEYLGRQVKTDDTVRTRTDQGTGDFEGFFADYTKRMDNRRK